MVYFLLEKTILLLKGNAVIKNNNHRYCQCSSINEKKMILYTLNLCHWSALKRLQFLLVFYVLIHFFIISCFIATELYLLLFLISTIDVDLCASSPCKNNGTCVDLTNRFQCQCPLEFNGTTCSTGIKLLLSKIRIFFY